MVSGFMAANLRVLGGQVRNRWATGDPIDEALLTGREVLFFASELNPSDLDECVALVASQLDALGIHGEQSVQRLAREIARFLYRLPHEGVYRLSEITPEHAAAFIDEATAAGAVWRDPSISTRYFRRSAIRLFFGTARQLHLVEGDPTLDIRLPPRSTRVSRPLEDDEIVLGRLHAHGAWTETRQPAAWALAEATATTAEIAVAQVGDLDLDSGTVQIHGSSKRDARTGHLTAWGVTALSERLDSIGHTPENHLVHRAHTSAKSAQSSTSTALRAVLNRAGFGDDPAIKPESVAAWAGWKVFEQTLLIEDAARALGVRRLDQAAEIIGWDWRG